MSQIGHKARTKKGLAEANPLILLLFFGADEANRTPDLLITNQRNYVFIGVDWHL
jgi:hypothetical protein